MKQAIKLITDIVNSIHDMLTVLTNSLGLNLTDKDLHFWVIGIIGLIILIFVDVLFRMLSKWSITSIAFVYTFTVILVIVFAIEIQQKITGRGFMEFADVKEGVYGFFAFSFLYLTGKFLFEKIKQRYFKKYKGLH
jgi:hypothetical protein